MAIISDTTKIDKAFKFVSGKSYTTTNKGVDNEDAPSGFIIGTSSIFSQDGAIPAVAPGVSTSILTYYDDGSVFNRFALTYDISSPTNRTWYASTDGSSLSQMRATRQGNWVPPTFGNYTIRIFLTNGPSTTSPVTPGNAIEIFFSDATAPLFDYKSGILTFETNPVGPSGAYPAYDGVQIGGYRYVGPLLSQIFDGNGNYTGGLSNFVGSGVGTSLAKFIPADKSFFVSSPDAIGTTFVTETGAYLASWKSVTMLSNGKIVAGGDNGSTGFTTYSYGAGVWFTTSMAANLTQVLGVWSSGSTAYAVGAGGTKISISTNDAIDWTNLTDPGIGTIKAIWGSSTTDIFILGSSPNAGTIYHSTNGTTFTSQTSGTTNNLVSVWGSSSSDIYAVGDTGTIRHSTGTGTWSAQTSGTANNLKAVFGLSSTAVYAVGNSGTVLFSTGTGTWTAQTGLPGTFYATGIWGSTNGTLTRLYISGQTNSGAGPGAVYVSDGTGTWSLHTAFGSAYGLSIYGGINGVYVGSNNGNIVALHQNPVLHVNGNTLVDGYLGIGLSLEATRINAGNIVATSVSSSIHAIRGISATSGIGVSASSNGGTGLFSSTTNIGIGADISGGSLVGSVGLKVANLVNRDTLGSSNIQTWTGQNNSGAQLVASLDSFGDFTLTGFIDMLEITPPSTPSAAHGRLYFKSNGIVGSGHRTQLAIKWPDGSETIIAESLAT